MPRPVAGAGELRESVTIQRQVSVPDGGGGERRVWQDETTVRARVLPAGSGDAVAVGEGLIGQQQYRLDIRFGPSIEIDDRIVWRGRVLKVLASFDETGKRRFLTIITDRGVVTA